VDLRTQYLGLTLSHPFMPGASPLDGDLDTVLRLEDAGASALVMHSLFEEDVERAAPTTGQYLELLLRLKRRVAIPVVASLNGTTAAGWLKYAGLLERAGADALELNFYHVAADVHEDAASVEHRILDIVAVLKESVRIPLAVKLSPFYSALPHLAAQLDRMGADGLVLFNRFYQPDIDAERCEPSMLLHYSDSTELPLRLRWIAILSGRVKASLALTGGVHEPIDAVKSVLAGAHAVQIVSALMKGGPRRLTAILDGFARWGDERGYASVDAMRGAASKSQCANPEAFERGNYQELLQAARQRSLTWSGH
jgi:dihydroorotate dehydrogenase (fumarate)